MGVGLHTTIQDCLKTKSRDIVLVLFFSMCERVYFCVLSELAACSPVELKAPKDTYYSTNSAANQRGCDKSIQD